MALVTISILATSTDGFPRFHGLAVDGDLLSDFWLYQTDKMIGNTVDGEYSPFNWEGQFELTQGTHRVVYGNSGYAQGTTPQGGPWPWHTKIFVDGKLVGEGDVGREVYLSANFEVGVAPPPSISWQTIAIAGVGFALLAGVVYVAGRKR